jgi:hypothetical protein
MGGNAAQKMKMSAIDVRAILSPNLQSMFGAANTAIRCATTASRSANLITRRRITWALTWLIELISLSGLDLIVIYNRGFSRLACRIGRVAQKVISLA